MKYKLAILFILLVLLSSCSSFSRSPPVVDYHSGTKGLVLEFIGDSPPDKLYEDTSFPVAILISNQGAFSLNETNHGLLSISYDDFYLKKTNNVPFEDEIILEGKSTFYPEGEVIITSLPSFKAKEIFGQRENPETDLFVSACYPYKTFFADQACMDLSEISNDIRHKVCDSEVKTYDSQGAPIAVIKIEPEMQVFGSFIRPSFLITVQNKGSGAVMAPIRSEDNFCKIKNASWNKVLIDASLSNSPLKCEPKILTLRDGEGYSRCYLESGGYASSLNYLTNLIITLDYNYFSTISKTISIERSDIPYFGAIEIGDCNNDWEVEIDGICKDACEFYNTQDNWGCNCNELECLYGSLTDRKHKRLDDLLRIEGNETNLRSSNCMFFESLALCPAGKYCCRKDTKSKT